MARLVALLLVGVAVLASCAEDRVRLQRGPLGPAAYRVRTEITGAPALGVEDVSARLRVESRDGGAALRLAVAGAPPVVAVLRRQPSGRLELDTVQNVPPRSAGEADLASLASQLDPPLPRGPVRMGQRWSATRRIDTETVQAVLTSRLRVTGFRRVGGTDAVRIQGTVRGRLRTSGQAGQFEGDVSGRTRIDWALGGGRVVASETSLTWRAAGAGTLWLRTVIRPA